MSDTDGTVEGIALEMLNQWTIDVPDNLKSRNLPLLIVVERTQHELGCPTAVRSTKW